MSMVSKTTVLAVALSLLFLCATVVIAKELPKPTDEEEDAKIAPPHMMCDACAASVFHISWKLMKGHKDNFDKKLKLGQVYDIIDEACMPRTYATTYGTKDVDGKHHLSGDGVKWFSHQSPTVGTLQPGMWLVAACREIVGAYDEEGLYEMYRTYRVNMGYKDKADTAMFREICVEKLKRCTPEEGLATYDNYEPEDAKLKLRDEL